jgi:hypothetical protein
MMGQKTEFKNNGMFVSIYKGKPVLPFAIRDEVAVRELFAILQYTGKMPYQTLKSHATVKPEFPDWILKDLNTGEVYLADAKELAQEDDPRLINYLERGVKIIVCWKSRLSKKFKKKYPGLVVIECADYFYEPAGFFKDVILPMIKEIVLFRLSDVKFSSMRKASVGSARRRSIRDMYKFTVTRGHKTFDFQVYCDDEGLRWYGTQEAHIAMRDPKAFAEDLADDFVRRLVV